MVRVNTAYLSGDCLLFLTLLNDIKRQWIFSIHRYLRGFLHLHNSCVCQAARPRLAN
jgi:hypothetical protein